MAIINVLFFFLRIGMLFVPQHKYEEKIRQIKSLDEKNVGFDLRGWEYRAVKGPSGFVHHYYYFPSGKPNAPVFLFFHGLNLDGRTFMNVSSLADSFQLVAYDLPENTDRYHGKFEDFMDIVYEFVDVMKIKECWIGGVSFGGSIALRLAVSPQVKAQGLVLASIAIVGSTDRERKQRKAMADWVRKQPDYKLYWFMEKVFDHSERAVDKDTLHAVADILRLKHPAFYRQVGLSMQGYDATVDARKLACPVLWLMGDKDNLFSLKQVAKIKQYVPQAQLEVIKGGTHAMFFMRGEEMAKRIKEFCFKVPALQ